MWYITVFGLAVVAIALLLAFYKGKITEKYNDMKAANEIRKRQQKALTKYTRTKRSLIDRLLKGDF